jgi:hypothetical protein
MMTQLSDVGATASTPLGASALASLNRSSEKVCQCLTASEGRRQGGGQRGGRVVGASEGQQGLLAEAGVVTGISGRCPSLLSQ